VSLSGSIRNHQARAALVRCTAFKGHRCIASGGLTEVALKTKAVIDQDEDSAVLVFDDTTSEVIEIDWRGTAEDVLRRLNQRREWGCETSDRARRERRGPGRPKLGVVAREVTLLPRHWEWLEEQPGGASVVLRKLVEAARRSSQGQDRARRSQEAVHRFMWAMTGDLPGFEEASRAFYARNEERFDAIIKTWPADIREHVRKLAATAMKDAAGARQCPERIDR
jgi:uncharacterized protein